MNEQLIIPKKILLPLAVVAMIMVLLGAAIEILHWPFLGIGGNFLMMFGAVLSFIVWIVVLIDIIKSKNKNAILWIIALVLFGSLTPIVYLLTKNKL